MLKKNEIKRSRWWSKPCEEPVEESVEEVEEPVEEVVEFVRALSKGRLRDRSSALKLNSWMAKAHHDNSKKRYRSVKASIFIITSVLAFGSTIANLEIMYQAILYLIWAGFFFLCDPLGMWGKFISLPCRLFIGWSCAAAIVVFVRPGVDTVGMLLISIAATYLTIKYLNKQWLMSDNWYMSDHAQKSMSYDMEDISGKSWQADGKREARSLLYELGLEAKDEVLDTYGLPLYKLGYCGGLKKTVQIDAMKEKLENLKEEHQRDTETIQELKEQVESFEAEEEKTRGLLLTIPGYKKQIAELEHKVQQLLQANEELLNGDPLEEYDNIVPFKEPEEPEEVEEVPEERAKNGALTERDIERILKLKAEGCSYGNIAKEIGCSKSTALKYCKQA